MPARCAVGELPGGPADDPASGADLVEPEEPGCGAGRPAGPNGVVDQVEQAGLDVFGDAWRDRAGGQSQRAFPSCRCSATACSVTVARSRSISAVAAANA